MEESSFRECFSFIIGCLLSLIMIVIVNVFLPTNELEQRYITDESVLYRHINEQEKNEDISELDEFEIVYQNMQQELHEIDLIENKEEWFVKYKEIIFKYNEWFGMPETIFDIYSKEELELIFRTVETECYDQNFNSKCNVASVIFNRIENDKFGDSVKNVITSPNQFAYWRKNITESTVLSVMYAFEIGDTTNGCIAFRSDKCPKIWCGWTYLFTDDAGHNFYK